MNKDTSRPKQDFSREEREHIITNNDRKDLLKEIRLKFNNNKKRGNHFAQVMRERYKMPTVYF
jgi:hypothetical protein